MWGSLRQSLRQAAPALLAYAAVRALGLIVLATWSSLAGKDFHRLVTDRWDSQWYARVAEGGYGFLYHSKYAVGLVHSDYAFFPLFPGLMRLLSSLTPLSAADAGLLIAWISSLFAAWGIFSIGFFLYGKKPGIALAVLWGVIPLALVESISYTESLFTALCAWSLYSVLRGRWILAGVFAIFAGLTRPSAAALVLALVVTAVVAAWRSPTSRRSLAMWVGVLIAPLGWVAYVAWVGWRLGSPTGYFEVQKAWGNGIDFGASTFGRIGELFAEPWPSPLSGVLVAIGLGLVVALFLFAVREKQPLVLLVFTGTIVVLALISAGYFSSRVRLTVPAFPLLLPFAVRLARVRLPVAIAIVSVLAVGSALYGGYLLVVSRAAL